jgi:hypothetical protein
VSEEKLKIPQAILRIWRWLRDEMVEDVPEDIAICEYDCRKRQCVMGEWEVCDRRLNQAAGELMPTPRKTQPGPG